MKPLYPSLLLSSALLIAACAPLGGREGPQGGPPGNNGEMGMGRDGGNLIVDAAIRPTSAGAAALHAQLKALPGVVETGFFLSEATRVLVADESGEVQSLGR